MDYDQLKQDIIEFSKEIGIDKIGFASSDPFIEMKNKLIRQQELGFQSGFEHKNIDERVDPSLIFERPRSIIAIALAYPSRMENPPRGKKEKEGACFVALLGESIITSLFVKN